MARIKIKDLPKQTEITDEEMKKVFGGLSLYSWRQTSLSSRQWTARAPSAGLLGPGTVMQSEEDEEVQM